MNTKPKIKKPSKRKPKTKKSNTKITVIEHPRMCYYVSPGAFVPEANGYLVWVVRENEPGYRPTGVWPCGPRDKRPYFWGPTLKEAEKAARVMNERLGLTQRDVFEIIASSMRLERATTGAGSAGSARGRN